VPAEANLDFKLTILSIKKNSVSNKSLCLGIRAYFNIITKGDS